MDSKKLDNNMTKAADSNTQPQSEPKAESLPHSQLETDPVTSAPATDNSQQPVKSGVSSGFAFNLVLIILLSVTTLAGGYYLYNEQQLQHNWQQAQAKKQAELLKQALNKPSEQIAKLKRSQAQLVATTQQEINALTSGQRKLNERIASIAMRNPNQWLANEAKYLVTMAGNKLWLEKDPATAASLLKAADERIESMNDPALTPLRKALAQDIAAVSAIKNIDITGTILAIDSMIEQLHKLELNRADIVNKANSITTPQMTDSVHDWQSNLTKSLQALIDDFVVVRKRTTDNVPLLRPDQEWYLVENITNKLLQSQLALYRQDEVNYRQSLTLAKKWIHQYFDSKSPLTQEMLATIEVLITLEIQATSINQLQSMILLQELVTHGNITPDEEKAL